MCGLVVAENQGFLTFSLFLGINYFTLKIGRIFLEVSIHKIEGHLRLSCPGDDTFHFEGVFLMAIFQSEPNNMHLMKCSD